MTFVECVQNLKNELEFEKKMASYFFSYFQILVTYPKSTD